LTLSISGVQRLKGLRIVSKEAENNETFPTSSATVDTQNTFTDYVSELLSF
jgi:hypothetical protein